jgi:hypothetical protein
MFEKSLKNEILNNSLKLKFIGVQCPTWNIELDAI